MSTGTARGAPLVEGGAAPEARAPAGAAAGAALRGDGSRGGPGARGARRDGEGGGRRAPRGAGPGGAALGGEEAAFRLTERPQDALSSGLRRGERASRRAPGFVFSLMGLESALPPPAAAAAGAPWAVSRNLMSPAACYVTPLRPGAVGALSSKQGQKLGLPPRTARPRTARYPRGCWLPGAP